MGIQEIRTLKANKKPKNKGIPKRSEKQKDIIKELKNLYPVFLKSKPLCEIQGPKCTVKATCVHHSEGRLPSKVLLMSKWYASCYPCNLWCETHHKAAAEAGFKKSKFKK